MIGNTAAWTEYKLYCGRYLVTNDGRAAKMSLPIVRCLLMVLRWMNQRACDVDRATFVLSCTD